MGCCGSQDTIPPVPKEIQPDPGVQSKEDVVIKALSGGLFSSSRDFGVWNKDYPKTNELQRELMWLWLNKGNIGNQATIDLENFVRGTKEDKLKGKVLVTAHFDENPNFTQTNRYPGGGMTMSFPGIFTTGLQYSDDYYYMQHQSHTSKIAANSHPDGPNNKLITKFSLQTYAKIFGGDTGRFEGTFEREPLILEVFSTGTAATTYMFSKRMVEDRNPEGQVTGHHEVTDYHKYETEFVDRVEFRLSFRGSVIDQWCILGDSHSWGGADPNFSCTLFSAVQSGGFFAPHFTKVSTTGRLDPALSILLAHVCTTEFSVAAVKGKFRPQTPQRPHPVGIQFMAIPQAYNSAFVAHNAPAFQFPF